MLFSMCSIHCLQHDFIVTTDDPGFALIYHVLGLGLEGQVFGLGFGL